MAIKFAIDLMKLAAETGGEVDELFADLEAGAVAARVSSSSSEAWSTRFVAEGQKGKTGPAAAWAARFTAEGAKPAPPARHSPWSARFSAEGSKIAPSSRWSARFTAEGTKTDARVAR